MAEGRPRRLRTTLWITAGTVATIVVLGAATVLYVRSRDTTTAVSVDEAIGSFRDVGTDAAAEPLRPAPGVYVYETVGSESIDALGGATHNYPDETTMSVTLTDCGYQVRWDVFEERFDELDLCVTAEGESVATTRQYREFFGFSNDRIYQCDADALVRTFPPVFGETRTTPCTAESSDGDISVTVVGSERVDVGGEQVDALHVLLETTLRGDARGTSTLHYWIDPATGLIFRRESSVSTDADSPLGVTHYDENYTVQLVSRTPRH